MLTEFADVSAQAFRDIAASDEHAGLEVVSCSALGEVRAGDEGGRPVDHCNLGMKRSPGLRSLFGRPPKSLGDESGQLLRRIPVETRVVLRVLRQHRDVNTAGCGSD